MPSLPAMLLGSLLLFMATVTASQPGRRGRRKVYQFQHGQCSYTFMLPELQPCARDSRALGASNILPRDPPASVLHLKHRPGHRVRQLEKALENNTQWLQKLERYLQMSLRPELTRTQKHIVRNQTASVLELSSSLQNRTSAQAHKLTDMEAQILNQTSRMEGQMLETLLSTDKLERQLGLHSRELLWLDDRNSNLETRVRALETQQEAQLASLRQEKERMRHLLGHYNGTLARLEHTLSYARSNSSLLHRQQQELLESVQLLARSLAEGSGQPGCPSLVLWAAGCAQLFLAVSVPTSPCPKQPEHRRASSALV
ncbi:angiopoietin-4-like [Ctenodactylus gundi]